MTTTTTPAADPLNLIQYGDLPRSGQFYRIDKDFLNPDINALLTVLHLKMCTNNPGSKWSTVRQSQTGSWTTKGCRVVASALVAQFDDEPSFLDGASSVKDSRHGYVILAEITLDQTSPIEQRFLFIQRLCCPDPLMWQPDPLPSTYPIVDPLPEEVFLEPFTSDAATRIESLAMHPLGISQRALRRKLLEAYDIRSTTSSLGLNRTVAGAMKVFNANLSRRTTLRPSNKRLQQSGGRCSFIGLMEWAVTICDQFYNSRNALALSSPFLSAFAEAVSNISSMTAEVCLVEAWILRERTELTSSDKLEFFDGSVTPARRLTAQEVEDILENLEQFVLLKATPTGAFVGTFASTGPVTNLKIEVMTKTCKLTLPKCRLLVSSGTGEGQVALAKYLNDSKFFRITLDGGKVLFSSSGIHRDGNLKKSASLLMSIIRSERQLGHAKTEKGDQLSNAANFDSSSVFSLIETKIANGADWLLCDDSSDEWADYISLSDGINGKVLRWYHAKLHRHYDKADKKKQNPLAVSTFKGMRSATNLQEVVGQAVKNLGRVRLQQPDIDIDNRISLWSSPYAWPDGKKLVSAMPRLRHTPSGISTNPKTQVKAFLKKCAEAGSSPATRVEVAIVTPNYSETALNSMLMKLGTSGMVKTAPQVFWLLSGFMSSCVEAGVSPVIYCRDS
jgi:hypothetical protein